MSIKAVCTPISEAEFNRLSEGARVLEMDLRGDKVLLTPDDHIIKLFYPRRRLTSANIYPYAMRFWNHAQRLRELDIPTVRCEQLRYDSKHKRHLISYPLLAGTTLRDCLQKSPGNDALLEKFQAFLAHLHDKGVLFRSIHFGNILVLENGTFGLIDIADMSITRRPLGLIKRARNFRHMLHDRADRISLDQFGAARFIAGYENAAGIAGFRQRLFHALLGRYAPAMRP